jgi:hypothetical protein
LEEKIAHCAKDGELRWEFGGEASGLGFFCAERASIAE